MPPESGTPGSPSEWLRRAYADLALAKAPLPSGALFEDLCFHAQQAAEKAIKAVYRAWKHEFRYTLDLTELLDGLVRHGVAVPEAVREAEDLTSPGTLAILGRPSRYPGLNTTASLPWPKESWGGLRSWWDRGRHDSKGM